MMERSIENWSAWAPGLRNRADWETPRDREAYLDALEGHASPDVEWVPPRKRRRCSHLTRIALHVGFDCCNNAGVDPGEVKSVFATRHGEINLTTGLLETLADDELLSPMAFGNSVHNTPSSYFCMCADNHHPSRTVSAGEATFQNGFLDAVSLSDLAPDRPVLFVLVHVTPPEPLDRFDPLEESAWGVAFLLTESPGSFDLAFSRNDREKTDTGVLPPSIIFLDWLLHGASPRLQLAAPNTSHSWVWLRPDQRETQTDMTEGRSGS